MGSASQVISKRGEKSSSLDAEEVRRKTRPCDLLREGEQVRQEGQQSAEQGQGHVFQRPKAKANSTPPQWTPKAIEPEVHERLHERGINFENSCDAMIYEITHGTPRGNEITNRILGDMLTVQRRQRDWLSSREIEVLKLLAEGLRIDAIAHALQKSVETIKTQLVSAKRILGADTPAHAVALAIRQGYFN